MHVLGEMVFHEVPSGIGALTASMVRHPFTLHIVLQYAIDHLRNNRTNQSKSCLVLPPKCMV